MTDYFEQVRSLKVRYSLTAKVGYNVVKNSYAFSAKEIVVGTTTDILF